MSKKTAKTTAKVTKFEKNAFYQSAKGDLWQCVTGKTRKAPDGNTVVDMRAAPAGEPTGEPVEEYVDTIVKKLTTKELKEWREVAQREAEALAAADAEKKPETTANATETTTTATVTTEKPAKTPKDKKAKQQNREGKMSALDAAAKVLGETQQAMSSKDLITSMSAKGYWTSPGGQTPAATLYAAMIREINVKGTESRFQKTDKGRFALAGITVAAPETEPAPEPKPAKKGKKAKTEAALTEAPAAEAST
jgi:hypothetical protein